MRAEGYSIWLIPSGDVYQKLAEIISQLSDKYSAPNFEPHVTLIGDLLGAKEEIISKTTKLAGSLKPFEIKLKRVDYLDEYFKCLFVRAEKTKELIQTNNLAKEIFNRKFDPEFMPHLSLLYGDFIPEIKEKILGDLGREFNIDFEVKSIHLFSTTGEVKDWHRIKEFPLKP